MPGLRNEPCTFIDTALGVLMLGKLITPAAAPTNWIASSALSMSKRARWIN
jgi:hypothetical protein